MGEPTLAMLKPMRGSIAATGGATKVRIAIAAPKIVGRVGHLLVKAV